jgi:hypothetical protein
MALAKRAGDSATVRIARQVCDFWCGHKQRLDHGKMQCESFMLSIVKGIKPIDQLETMLETQISALAKRRILPNACRRFWSCWRGPKTRLKNQ